MKKFTRFILIFLTSFSLTGAIAYATFLVSIISDETAEIINNTYKVILHYENEEGIEETINYTILEEDSTFDLPVLSYSRKKFSGWSIYESRSSSFDTTLNTSIKDIKNNFPDVTLVDNILNLYAIVNEIDQNSVLLVISGDAIEADNQTYYLKTNAGKFNVFNIRYVYPPHFLTITFNGTKYGANDVIDLTPFGGQEVKVVANQAS